MKTQETSARSGLHRALIVVWLLAGVFAMHGLTGNHDSVALTHAAHPAAATPDTDQPRWQASLHATAHRAPAGNPPAAAAAVNLAAADPVPLSGITVRPAQEGHAHAMGDVCLAMLTALALAIAGALVSRSLRATRPVVRLRAGLVPMITGPSPPWLQPTLWKLCVLRT
jgi:hypothetical protein